MSTNLQLSDDDDTDNDEEMKSSNNTFSKPIFNKEEFEQTLKECRDKLSQNPNDYTAHLNVVNCLSNIQYIHQFRKARDKMYKKFAIPPLVSIKFISVETEYLYQSSNDTLPTIEQINNIIQLFKNAIYDYPNDINLWSNYLTFTFQYLSIIGINGIRENILNEGIRSIGQHFFDAHKFWSLYREFETEYLAILVNKQTANRGNVEGGDTPDIEDIDGMDSDNDNNDDMDKPNIRIEQQTKRIRKIWRQQINIPHFQIEETYRNYQDWECNLYGKASTDYKHQYNTSKKLSKYFKDYEARLTQLASNISPGYASLERLEFWQQYILGIRQKIKNIKPKTVQSLYERAILECFLHETIWIDYIEWIKENNLKFEIIDICARSIRNIPLSVRLWTEYINGCQWTEKDIDDVNKRIFARFVFPTYCDVDNDGDGFNFNLQKKYKIKKDEIVNFGNDIEKYIMIGIAKCEYYRRRAHCFIDELYEENDNKENEDNNLIKEAERIFDEMAVLIDNNILSRWSLTFYTFYTDFLSRFVGDIDKARNVWNKLTRKRGKEWNVWTAFIEWESNFGEIKPVPPSSRKRNNNNMNIDENDNGILRKKHGQRNIYRIRWLYHKAINILDIDNGLQYIGERLLQFERMCGDLESYNKANIRYQKKLKEKMKQKEKNEKKRIKTKKRKRNIDDGDNMNEWNKKEKEAMDTENTKNEENDDYEEEIDENKEIKRKETTKERRQRTDPNYIDIDNKGTKEERTVFVLNFRKTATLSDIRELFSKYGKIESIKLPSDQNAKHRSKLKGFGYIEFKHKDYAKKSIKELNNKQVQGKILSVQRYRNKNDHTKTVYIKGLSGFNELSADQCIKSILSNCGEIREIRLTREKNSNKLKGFGYVEFVNDGSVKNALKCDKTTYKNKIIEVKPYKTEQQREREKDNITNTMDVDNDNDDNQHNEINKVSSDFVNKLGFLPRSIGKRKAMLKKTQNNKDKDDNHNNDKQLNQKILNKTNKSQDDFRKLFNI